MFLQQLHLWQTKRQKRQPQREQSLAIMTAAVTAKVSRLLALMQKKPLKPQTAPALQRHLLAQSGPPSLLRQQQPKLLRQNIAVKLV